MNDYQKLIKQEAKTFYESVKSDFEASDGTHGGKTDQANFALWIDDTGRLTSRVEEVAKAWGSKEHAWVKNNSRNKPKEGGGNPGDIAFICFFQDVRHEIKKVAKGKK